MSATPSMRLLGGLWVALLLLLATPASAHPALSSAVYLDFHHREVKAELHVPVDQLEMALQRPIERSAGGLSDAESAALSSYLRSHVGMAALQGAELGVLVDSIRLARIDEADHIVAELRAALDPGGPGASLDRLTLRYDVVLHRVVTHKIFVLARRDVERGLVDGEPRALGTLRYQHATLAIDRSDASRAKAARALFALGARHIAEGSDHLLFLLLLLLPAPFAASGRRWSELRSLKGSAGQILAVVTAFTLGHSITLAAGAIGLLRLPARPVEVLIAASILLSAVHAAVPVFPRREFVVAAGFGLVHGLAFSTVLADIGLRGGDLVLSLLAFNLGIEAMQLVVVLLAAPWIVLIGRGAAAAPVRMAGAAFGGCAAVLWMGERALGLPNPLGRVVDGVFAHPAPAIGALAAVAVIAAALRPIRRTIAAS